MQLFHKNVDPLLFMCCRNMHQRPRVINWGVMQVTTGWGSMWGYFRFGIPDYSCPSHKATWKTSSTRSLCPSPCCQSDVQQKTIDAVSARDWRESFGGKNVHAHTHKDAHVHTHIGLLLLFQDLTHSKFAKLYNVLKIHKYVVLHYLQNLRNRI